MPLSPTECPASSGIPAEGPDHQSCHGPLRQRASALLPGETGTGAQGQRRLCALHRGEERYCPCSCWHWVTDCRHALLPGSSVGHAGTQGVRLRALIQSCWSRRSGGFICCCLSLLWSPRGSSMACGGTGTQEHQSSKAPWSALCALKVPSPTPQGLFLLSIRPMQGYCSGGGVQEETHKCLFE